MFGRTKRQFLAKALCYNCHMYSCYGLSKVQEGYLFPATSSTCSSVASASSAGSLLRRLSRNERTLRLAQPPNSLGTLLKRLRSTFRLVSFFSLPSERGSDFKEGREKRLIISKKKNAIKLNRH